MGKRSYGAKARARLTRVRRSLRLEGGLGGRCKGARVSSWAAMSVPLTWVRWIVDVALRVAQVKECALNGLRGLASSAALGVSFHSLLRARKDGIVSGHRQWHSGDGCVLLLSAIPLHWTVHIE